MTPMELMENDACVQIAQAVGCEKSPAPPDTFAAGWVASAKEIERRLLQRQTVALERLPDPFGYCLYRGCPEKAEKTTFCPAHRALVPADCLEGIDKAIAAGDLSAYRINLVLARATIRMALPPVAAHG